MKIIKLSSIVLLLLFIGASCQKDDISCPCGIEKSFSTPDWINDLQIQLENDSKICFAEITLYEWDSLYYVQLRTAVDSAFDPPNVIYDCEGNIIKECGGTHCTEICEDFTSKAIERQTLWTYDDAPCSCSANGEFVEPEWLTEYIDNLENDSEIIYGDVTLYKWKNKYYIAIGTFFGAYDLPGSLYDCNGNLIYNVGGLQPTDCSINFLRESQKIETLWKK